MSKEGWGGTSSGLLDNYAGTVLEAWFGTDEKLESNPDKVFLFWKMGNIITEDEIQIDEWTERYSIGSGWEIVNNGKEVIHEDGKTKFNAQTDYGRIINRVLGDNGGGKEGAKYAEEFEGAFDYLVERGDQNQAEVWEGLRFQIKEHEFSAKIKQEDGSYEEVEWQRNLPVAFLGEDDGTSTVSEKREPKSRKELEEELTSLAQESDDHPEFMAKALEIDGVADDAELLEDVSDDGKEGFYQRVN